MGIDPEWWKTFFDRNYLHLWSQQSSDRTEAEVELLCRMLDLGPASRVLDGPCGYGRISLPLARRGMVVLGVDYSRVLLAEAERRREGVPREGLRYLEHDLREPLAETGFDAALNVFTSLGYGTEEDDRRIMRTLHEALRPGGQVLVETIHRDSFAALVSQDQPIEYRLDDGTVEQMFLCLDFRSARADITYRWEGPTGSGEKRSSVRIYSVAELLGLLASAGFEELRALQSRTGAPVDADAPGKAGRVCVIGRRAASR